MVLVRQGFRFLGEMQLVICKVLKEIVCGWFEKKVFNLLDCEEQVLI